MERTKLNFIQKTCVSLTGKAMHQTNMIWPGARIGVATSGGADSFVLLQCLLLRQRIVPFPFEIMALHVNPGFNPIDHAPLLIWGQARGLSMHIAVSDFGPRAHSKENRKNSPCFFCSWHRRKLLFQLCREYRLTHLALGHTADDLVSTFLMNLLQTGRVEGLPPSQDFFHGSLKVVRPLILIEKKDILKAVKAWELPVWENQCPSAQKSRRSEMLPLLDKLTNGKSIQRKNFFNALKRWQLDLSSRII